MREPAPPPQQQSRQAPPYPPLKDGVEQLPQNQAGPIQDEPRANVPCVVEIDGRSIDGTTDADGKIEISIPPGARSGRLVVEPGTPRETAIPLRLGHLNPISAVSGVKQRLSNLGFDCGDDSEEESEAFAAAVRAFQAKHGMDETGRMNDQTRQRLQDVHSD
jgi:hypothetical protein